MTEDRGDDRPGLDLRHRAARLPDGRAGPMVAQGRVGPRRALVGDRRVRAAHRDRGDDEGLGPGLPRPSSRREPPRLLHVAAGRARGLPARPYDARSPPVRGRVRCIPRPGRHRLHGAAALRRRGHRPGGPAIPAPRQAGKDRGAPDCGHARIFAEHALLQPVRAQRHTHGRVDPGSRHIHVAIPGRGKGPVPLLVRRPTGPRVRHQGDRLHRHGGAGSVPGLSPAARRMAGQRPDSRWGAVPVPARGDGPARRPAHGTP